MLHKLKIDNGLFLDGIHLKGVKAYEVKQGDGDDIACLTLKMDTVILSDKTHSDFNSLLDKE